MFIFANGDYLSSALRDFNERLRKKSRDVLEWCARENRACLLVIARPYHMDPGIGHEIEGLGRLAVGVREHFPNRRIADYHGVDVQPELIEWADANLAGPGFRFTCVDVSNERYNPDGTPERTLAADPGTVDVFYAYSVFSHMNDEDTPAYLKLIREALSDGGRAFVTCFVEEDVPGWEENPEGYGPLEWKGRLHCTRFARWHFEDHVNAARLAVDRFEYGQETDGQSLYVLRKR